MHQLSAKATKAYTEPGESGLFINGIVHAPSFCGRISVVVEIPVSPLGGSVVVTQSVQYLSPGTSRVCLEVKKNTGSNQFTFHLRLSCVLFNRPIFFLPVTCRLMTIVFLCSTSLTGRTWVSDWLVSNLMLQRNWSRNMILLSPSKIQT